MSKSSVVFIRYFKAAVLFYIAIMSGMSMSENKLSAEDIRFINNAQALSSEIRGKKIGIIKNRHEKTARQEAMEFYKDMQVNNKTLADAADKQRKKSLYTDHKILIFASLSMGDTGIDQLMESASQSGAAVVFRGFPDGVKFAAGLQQLQKHAQTKTPVPQVIINPVLFTRHNVTQIPTIVVLGNELSEDKTKNEVARVSGLSDPEWVTSEIKDGRKGDLGIRGPVNEISERDMTEVAKERMAKIDWNEKKEKAVARFWKKRAFNLLPSATRPRKREVDLSVYITRDILSAEGNVIVKEGTRINPLDHMPFEKAIVVFDPTEKKQLSILNQILPDIKKQYGSKIIYIATQFDRDSGWEGYKKITDALDAHVFLLPPDMAGRFQLEYTPSVITAGVETFTVEEFVYGGGLAND